MNENSVFLSHSSRDASLARFVRGELQDRGFEVSSAGELLIGDTISDGLRTSVAEATAVLLLATEASLRDNGIVFEAGIASAFSKPAFVVFDGIDSSDLPVTLRELPQFRAADIDAIADRIESVSSPLSPSELESLRDIFATLGVSADEVLIRWPLRRELAKLFAADACRQVSDEVLVREILRMRKRGGLSGAHVAAGV